MRRLLATQHAFEAHLVKTVLEAHGVGVRLHGEGLGANLGAPMLVPVEVWVDEAEHDEALAILGRVTRRDEHGRLTLIEDGGATYGLSEADPAHAAAEPAACPACGAEWEPGFHVCWQCEHELPD